MKVIAGIIFVIMTVAPLAHADGLDTLIEVGRGQAEIQRAYYEETRRYERVKRAVDSGDIKKGQTKKEIMGEYGDPVVQFYDIITKRDEWIYKPAKSDFFGDGIKICLYFNRDSGVLDEIAVTGQEEAKK